MNKGLAALLALLAGISFGLGGAVSQVVRGFGYEVMHVVVAQTLLATVILAVLVAVKFKLSIPRKQAIALMLVGPINVMAAITYYFAIDFLSVGTTVAIQFQYVWIVVVFTAIATRTRPGRWTILSAVFIIVGSVLGSGLLDELLAGAITMDPRGLVCALACALCYATFIFLNGRVAVEYDPVQRTFYETVGSLVVVAIVAALLKTPACDVATLVPWGILMALIMCVLPVLFIIVASTNLPGGLVSILTSSELPMAVISGCLILGETVTPLVVAGVVVILGAIVLAQLDNKASAPAA